MIAAHRAETPEREAESAVWVEAEGDVPAGVQLALQLHGAAQGSRGGVGHFDTSLGWRNIDQVKHIIILSSNDYNLIKNILRRLLYL